ncbi:hypothetical protein RFI_16828, partial [Reticulomyxa filosa]
KKEHNNLTCMSLLLAVTPVFSHNQQELKKRETLTFIKNLLSIFLKCLLQILKFLLRISSQILHKIKLKQIQNASSLTDKLSTNTLFASDCVSTQKEELTKFEKKLRAWEDELQKKEQSAETEKKQRDEHASLEELKIKMNFPQIKTQILQLGPSQEQLVQNSKQFDYINEKIEFSEHLLSCFCDFIGFLFKIYQELQTRQKLIEKRDIESRQLKEKTEKEAKILEQERSCKLQQLLEKFESVAKKEKEVEKRHEEMTEEVRQMHFENSKLQQHWDQLKFEQKTWQQKMIDEKLTLEKQRHDIALQIQRCQHRLVVFKKREEKVQEKEAKLWQEHEKLKCETNKLNSVLLQNQQFEVEKRGWESKEQELLVKEVDLEELKTKLNRKLQQCEIMETVNETKKKAHINSQHIFFFGSQMQAESAEEWNKLNEEKK